MDAMYPHAIDRLRVMSLLLRAWRCSLHTVTRKTCVYNQAKLASKAGYKDKDTISDLENLSYLERVACGKEKGKARKTLIDVLNFGLERSQKDIDAMLWLYEGEAFIPLQINEVSDKKEKKSPSQSPSLMISPLKIESANQYTDSTKLHTHIIDLLTASVKIFIPEPIMKDAKVQMIFELDQPTGLQSDQVLLEMECEPGQRLVVTKYPSYLTYPPNIYDYGQWRGSYKLLPKEGKLKRRALTDERRRVFLEHLQVYGERCIHSKEALKRYLQPKYRHWLSYDERVKQVKHWIKLLRRYDHYQVGLTEAEPELDLAIKNTVGAFLSGPPGEIYSQETPSNQQSIHCGPWYVLWCDKKSIFAFFVDFERKWAAIPEEWRKKANVINWLKEMLPKSPVKLKNLH